LKEEKGRMLKEKERRDPKGKENQMMNVKERK